MSRVATGFARAYLAYEISQGGAKQRRVLSALGTESLSRQLLAAPVRAPAHGRLPVERVERVGEVRNATSEGRPAFTAAVVVDRDGLPVVLNLRMVGLPGRLRVAELGR